MRSKLVTILLTIVVTAPVAFYIGGLKGFSDGYGAAGFMQGGSAVTTVFMLRKLRGGDVEPVRDALEMQLDWLVVQRRIGRSGYESVFNLPRIVGVGDTMPSKGDRAVLKYRGEFPSAMPPPGKAEIDAALADLARKSARKE